MEHCHCGEQCGDRVSTRTPSHGQDRLGEVPRVSHFAVSQVNGLLNSALEEFPHFFVLSGFLGVRFCSSSHLNNSGSLYAAVHESCPASG